MKYLLFIVLLFLSILSVSCSDKTDSTEPTQKQYDVEYNVTINSGTIAVVKYLTEASETLSVADVSSFIYKWKSKGKAGNKTYVMLRLTNTSAKAYLKILADNNPIVSDSISGGGSSSTVEIERSVTLPY